LGQLLAILARAKGIGNGHFRRNFPELSTGIATIVVGSPVAHVGGPFEKLASSIQSAEERRLGLISRIERSKGSDRELPATLVNEVTKVVEDGAPIGGVLHEIGTADLNEIARKYWIRGLLDTALDVDDVPELVDLQSFGTTLHSYDTALRQAVRRIDFRIYGPSINR